MDIAKGLSELKIVMRGYERNAVHDLLKEVLEECEKEKEKALTELIRQNQSLQMEQKELKDRIGEAKEQNTVLLQNVTSMTEAMNKGTEYTRERDQELESYKKKEQEIDTLLESTRTEAEKEQNRILEQAKAEAEKILLEAETEKARILSDVNKEADQLIVKAKEEKEHILNEARCSYQERMERSVQIRKALDEMKGKVLPLLSWAEENLEENPDEVQEEGCKAPETFALTVTTDRMEPDET